MLKTFQSFSKDDNIHGITKFMKRNQLINDYVTDDKLVIRIKILASDCFYKQDDITLGVNDMSCLWADIQINVNGNVISAHKSALKASSELKRMIEENGNEIHLQDVTHQVFMEVLRFMYTGTIGQIEMEICNELLLAAQRFHLSQLKEACEKKLEQWNSMGNSEHQEKRLKISFSSPQTKFKNYQKKVK